MSQHRPSSILVAREITGDAVRVAVLELARHLHPDFGTAFERRFGNGRFFGFVPEGTSDERLDQFTSGGL